VFFSIAMSWFIPLTISLIFFVSTSGKKIQSWE
jgi:hypothetical protein